MPGLDAVGVFIEVGTDALGAIGISTDAFLPPLFNPLPQRDALKRITDKKVKVKNDEDGKRVVRGSDVADCIEKYFNSGSQIYDLFKGVASTLISQAGSESNFADIASKTIMDCVRKKYLRQDKPEVSKTGPHRSRK